MAQTAARMPQDDGEFEARYRTHRSSVVGLCRRLLGSAEQAEDAAHEVFVRAHMHRRDYDPARSFSSWVLSIATHHCVDLLRRRSSEAKLFGAEDVERAAIATGGPGPLGLLLMRERQQELREAIRQLPSRYRVPLVLSVYREHSYDEIADALHIPRSHVAVLIFRARQRLRQALGSVTPVSEERP